MFEGFTPHKVPVIVECLTDNKNRTASNVRVLFRKGQIGAMGSVAWMFDRVGVIEATHQDASIDIEAAAIEAGAQDVEPLDKKDIPEGQAGACFYTEPTDLDIVNKQLTEAGWILTMSELSYKAKNKVELTPEQFKEVSDFLSDIDDDDDVHRVYTAL